MNALEELSGRLEYLAYLEAAVEAAGFVVKHDGGTLGNSNFRLEPKLATDPCRCIDCGGDELAHSDDCAYMTELYGTHAVPGIDASPKSGSDATLAYWRVTFRMYRDDPELCVLFVGGQEKPTLDSIGVTPRPIELVNVEPRFVEQNRLAEPSIAVDPSTEVTPLTDAARSPVTDAMVELACNAFTAAGRRERALPSLSPRWMRAALEAALIDARPQEVLSGKHQCYGCHEYVTWLAPDSRCSSCTRLSPDEV